MEATLMRRLAVFDALEFGLLVFVVLLALLAFAQQSNPNTAIILVHATLQVVRRNRDR